MLRATFHGPPALPQLTVRTKYWFEVNDRFAIGEGGIILIRAIAERGSLARAAQSVGWSYRHAWGYLRRAERTLGLPLTTRHAGKGTHRGLDLTPAANALLRRAAQLSRAGSTWTTDRGLRTPEDLYGLRTTD